MKSQISLKFVPKGQIDNKQPRIGLDNGLAPVAKTCTWMGHVTQAAITGTTNL